MTKPKGPMGITTKILIGSALFAGVAIFFPQAIFWISVAASVLFVFLWFSRKKGQKGGRLIPALLLVGIPWGIIDTFYQGVARGEHTQDGFFVTSLMNGAFMPVGIYIVYLIILMLVEVFLMLGEALVPDDGRGPPPKDEPGPLARFWWV